jgi:hypothetical protein
MLSVIEDPYYLTRADGVDEELSARRGGGRRRRCWRASRHTKGDARRGAALLAETNPFIDEMSKKYNLPRDVVLGYQETLYPEYRQKMKK